MVARLRGVMTTETQTTSLGEAFAVALPRKDFDEVARLLHPQVDFRGLTPGRMWEASDARVGRRGRAAVVVRALGQARAPGLAPDTDAFADRERVGYRLPRGAIWTGRSSSSSRRTTERDGRIGWMRVVCSDPAAPRGPLTPRAQPDPPDAARRGPLTPRTQHTPARTPVDSSAATATDLNRSRMRQPPVGTRGTRR